MNIEDFLLEKQDLKRNESKEKDENFHQNLEIEPEKLLALLESSKNRFGSKISSNPALAYVEQKEALLEAKKREKVKILKNLLLICCAFLCNFVAFNGAQSLQSSLNHEEGLGTASLSTLYSTLIISAMFTPTIVINYLGCKWAITFSILGYVSYIFANFYPCWETLVPTSIILGMSAAPLWSAKCTYLTLAAKRYASLNEETDDAVVNRFFGIFFLFFQFTNIIGQLLSSFILSSGDSTNLLFPNCFNKLFIEKYCGANDCQEDLNVTRLLYNSSNCPVTDLQSGNPPVALIYTLMGIYGGISILGAVVTALFVDNIQSRETESRGFFVLLIATFKHMLDYRQLLLIPITMFSGFEQVFIYADITRSFVTCPLAVNWVGFVLIGFGICDSIFSYLFGKCEKYTGRPMIFSLAFLINSTIILVFLLWTPYPSSPVLFFLLPALWGVADAVWQTQLNALYGVLFLHDQEASFANYRLWESFGFVIAFAYQNYICVRVKLVVLLIVLINGMLLYYYVEYNERKRNTKNAKVSVGVNEEIKEKRAFMVCRNDKFEKETIIKK